MGQRDVSGVDSEDASRDKGMDGEDSDGDDSMIWLSEMSEVPPSS